MAIVITLAIVITISVSRPVRALMGTFKSIAAGNLEQEIDTTRTDEIGHLAKSFAYLRDDIRKKIRQLNDEIEERIRAEEALRKSEERYRAVMEDIPAMICRFLPDGMLTFVNSEYCRYLHKNNDELIGQNVSQFIPMNDQETVRNHFLSRTLENPMVTYTHQVIAPDGSIR